MRKYRLDLQSRRLMVGLIAVAVLVSLVPATVLLLSPKPPPETTPVIPATAGSTAERRPQPSPSSQLTPLAARATAADTPRPSPTVRPTATSPIVPFSTRAAVATERAGSGTASATPDAATPVAPWAGAVGSVGFVPAPTHTFTPSPEPTPAFIAVGQLPSPTPTPRFPEALVGKIVFFASMNRSPARAYAIDRDGFALVQLTADWPFGRAVERDARSPDGYYRVTVGHNLDTGETRLEVRDDETDAVIAVIASGPVYAPAWSPVSDKIAFVSAEDGNENVWVVNADGRARRQLTANRWAADTHPSWSPDGKQIVFTSNRSGKRRVWIMNADGSEQQPLTGEDYEAWDPVWVKYLN